MDALIKSVDQTSEAYRLGLRKGDKVLSVNDNDGLEDLFDFQFELMCEPELALEVRHADGSEEIITLLEAESLESLGFEFTSPVFTPIKTCNNACPFCFIDQQPEGLRASLYVKDDDWRLSYFCNTYITLTNLTRHDRERMEQMRPGPLYVSVHATTPDVRVVLLKNQKAGDIMKELTWLAELEIPFHAQLVICPGINDGEVLTRSLEDLATLQPHCLSVAIVPVGFTDYRDKLPEMTSMTKSVAEDVIVRLKAFNDKTKQTDFAFASDEFYVRAEQTIPGYESYADFPQLDDGVGGSRLLTDEFFKLEETLPESIETSQKYVVVTGKLGAMVLEPIVRRLNQIQNLYLDLIPIENKFWGEAVTVAGLITAKDILEQLSEHDLSEYTGVLIPETMLKSGDTVFLDDITTDELSKQLNCPVIIVTNPTEAQSLLDVLFKPLPVAAA